MRQSSFPFHALQRDRHLSFWLVHYYRATPVYDPAGWYLRDQSPTAARAAAKPIRHLTSVRGIDNHTRCRYRTVEPAFLACVGKGIASLSRACTAKVKLAKVIPRRSSFHHLLERSGAPRFPPHARGPAPRVAPARNSSAAGARRQTFSSLARRAAFCARRSASMRILAAEPPGAEKGRAPAGRQDPVAGDDDTRPPDSWPCAGFVHTDRASAQPRI